MPHRRVRAGQIVAAQVAVALPVAATGHGGPLVGVALLVGVLLLLAAGLRFRHRWLHEWLWIGLARLTRARSLPPAAGPAGLLGLVAPTAVLLPAELAGTAAAVVADAEGLTALVELDDPDSPLGDGTRELPAPLALLPPAGPESPPLRVQLLVTSAPAPSTGAGPVGVSYRQLTDGRLPAVERALLAVRVLRVDGRSDEELRPVLTSALRRIVRRVGPFTARALDSGDIPRVLAELAHHDDDRAVRESWSDLAAGGLLQTTFRLRRWPDPGRAGVVGAGRLVPRLLALPATATTVSVGVGPRPGSGPVPAELTVRLAAPDAAALDEATRLLHRLVADEGAEVRRLDGEQLDGLAGTLPLARPVSRLVGGRAIGSRDGAARPPSALESFQHSVGPAGLMIGADRHGAAVTARVFRPGGSWLMLVGGLTAAQLVILRAMALGARVAVQTTRPGHWAPFVRAVGGAGTALVLLPPGRPVAAPTGTPLRPVLVLLDVGPVPAPVEIGPGWQATVVLRDALTPADTEALARADLAVLQPLGPSGAALAGAALGLGDSAQWLTRIRDDMVAVVNRRALRWALLSPTPIESQLVNQGHRG